jgi:hypothetical protein
VPKVPSARKCQQPESAISPKAPSARKRHRRERAISRKAKVWECSSAMTVTLTSTKN